MMRPEPKGWCPGAHRPMASGDGLIVRVRPRMARLNRVQALGLADIAETFGNGMIDLTNRANLQLRGVKQAGLEPLLQGLAALDLFDVDAQTEARRNIAVDPLWSDDATLRIAEELARRLGELPDLPSKFGFVVDAGAKGALAGVSGDIRVERGVSDGLILRADGAALGLVVPESEAVDRAIGLAAWFAATGGIEAGRMVRLLTKPEPPKLPGWAIGSEAPRQNAALVRPGLTALGWCVGVAFGQMTASDLRHALPDGATAVRLTPWRMLILEGVRDLPAGTGFLTLPDDPLLSTDACPGAPYCAAATVETRDLARSLAGRLPKGKTLHVSGCAKGCARAGRADVTLVGADGRFGVVRGGVAWDMPEQTGLAPGEVSGACDALYL